MPRKESITKGRSHCDACQHILVWYDLFPLLSFLFLQGKCRYCRQQIGWQTILVEILTGVLFISTYYFLSITTGSWIILITSLIYVLYIFSAFLVIAFIDAKKGIIPNSIVYPGITITLLYHLFFLSTISIYLLSALGAGSFFFFLFAITKGRGMGFGDVKLALLLGLFLGFPNIVISLYVAFLTGSVVALILIIRKKKKFSGGTISFGPFLILGAFIAYFFGNFLWANIFHLFFAI